MPHIMEMVGKTRVVVKDGKVVEVGEPEVEWCPLFAKLRGVQDITPRRSKKEYGDPDQRFRNVHSPAQAFRR